MNRRPAWRAKAASVPAPRDLPAPYSAVLRNREFAGIVLAQITSEIGDHFARVGLAALVLADSGSVLLAALAFVAGYLPGTVGAALLSPLADRLPRRSVLLGCDALRAVLVGLLALSAVPGTPLWLLYLLLFAAELFTAPFDAARSALLPDVLGDPRLYLAGAGLARVLRQANQVLGLALAGGALLLVTPRVALALDALTFVLSFLLLAGAVRGRPAAAGETRESFLRDLTAGARLVFADPARRALVALGWGSALFLVAPEAVALAYARAEGRSSGWGGLLMAAVPAGAALGAWLVSRWPHDRQLRSAVPLAAGACLPLVASWVEPPVGVALVLWFASGASQGFMVTVIATVNLVTPPAFRGRVNGLAAAGFSVASALAFVLAGWVADLLSPARAAALAGLAGLVLLAPLRIAWPSAALRRAVRRHYAEPVSSPVP